MDIDNDSDDDNGSKEEGWIHKVELQPWQLPPVEGPPVEPVTQVYRVPRIDRRKPDPEIPYRANRRRWNKRYYEKNKHTFNARRRAWTKTLAGAYHTARMRALNKGQVWELTLEEWETTWENCPQVFDHELQCYRNAFRMRSRSPYAGTQFVRIDADKSWNKDNVHITYKLQAIPPNGIVQDYDLKRATVVAPKFDIEEVEKIWST